MLLGTISLLGSLYFTAWKRLGEKAEYNNEDFQPQHDRKASQNSPATEEPSCRACQDLVFHAKVQNGVRGSPLVRHRLIRSTSDYILDTDRKFSSNMLYSTLGEQWEAGEGNKDCRSTIIKRRSPLKICQATSKAFFAPISWELDQLDQPFSPEVTAYKPPFYFCR